MKLRLHSPRNSDPRRNWTYYPFVLFVAGVLSGCGVIGNHVAESKKAKSAENLHELYAAISTFYSFDSKGRYPSLSPERGQLAMDWNQMYPKYVSDPTLYISPAHPDAKKIASLDDPKAIIRDQSYWYLGYAFINEEGGLAFVEEYRKHTLEGTPFPDSMWSDSGTLRFMKLYTGVSRFLTTNIYDSYDGAGRNRALIPAIMIERPGLHEGGSNVLFSDGYVEFMEYPGEFPMTERFIHALESLDDLK